MRIQDGRATTDVRSFVRVSAWAVVSPFTSAVRENSMGDRYCRVVRAEEC